MVDIDTIDEAKIQNPVNDLALLSMTNADKWNYRFISAEDQQERTLKVGETKVGGMNGGGSDDDRLHRLSSRPWPLPRAEVV